MKKLANTLTLTAAALLAACQSGAGGAPQVADDNHDASEQWVLVAGQLNGKALNVQDGTVTLNQGKDAFTGVSAVNHYRVPVRIRGNNIEHLHDQPTPTLMA